MNDNIANPFAKPLYVMLKPAGAHCNLACKYCYYLEKNKLYPTAQRHLMSDEILEQFTREYIEAQTMNQVLFTWHGGEPLLRSIDFYCKALSLQQKYAGGRRIDNVIQTNGTLLTDEWCEFFAQNHWLVGISIDGPQPDHDHYRLTAAGKPSWKKVMQGIKLLKKHGVEWNAMAVVNAYNANHPLEFYRFFKENGCQFLQFTPIVERLTRHEDGRNLASLADKDEISLSEASVAPEQWGYFLCAIFDEWVRKDVGKIFVEIFDCTLANWMGISPGICAYSKECGHAGVMEHNGDVYSCDHFVFPEYKLGNIRDYSLIDMLYGEQQQEFSRLKHSSLPRQCKECDMEFACHGECPKNRFMKDKYGDSGLNYLCPGYYHYYQHVAPYMDYMKQELMSQRPPSNIMKVVQ
ncbi:anaerobic sulfatase-maturation protein [Prevotella copri]|uniref:Anaerobic sulfatase-maturation protein n=1 Tax=Segatella copri TaxID=165179 RepID=A0AAP2I7U0_9BACT|nr:anaerobic sulfatase-maturation protein [Segatella copri]MBU9910517.1 anaerobic sulfatase-maturation protein [Segatella copri]MBV3387826.1 anaerobic sulfatase-maturation protein [Segatella copri]MBV3395688.1 anaerobic sulfatase-maturation protein [Segatella copri]MBV3397994.1 anaerobic sulfatase-maturation protein [Segatella copri]MBV3405330.1 anaerobic sulfatase-maturation protein [Segatella copri]